MTGVAPILSFIGWRGSRLTSKILSFSSVTGGIWAALPELRNSALHHDGQVDERWLAHPNLPAIGGDADHKIANLKA